MLHTKWLRTVSGGEGRLESCPHSLMCPRREEQLCSEPLSRKSRDGPGSSVRRPVRQNAETCALEDREGAPRTSRSLHKLLTSWLSGKPRRQHQRPGGGHPVGTALDPRRPHHGVPSDPGHPKGSPMEPEPWVQAQPRIQVHRECLAAPSYKTAFTPFRRVSISEIFLSLNLFLIILLLRFYAVSAF